MDQQKKNPDMKEENQDKEQKAGEQETSRSKKTKTGNKKDSARELKKELEKVRAEAQANLDMARRVTAEYENFKKRSVQTWEEKILLEKNAVVRAFLEIYDNLERAVEAAEKTKKFEDFETGVQMIEKQFSGLLSKYGVEEISGKGSFDPNFHEALMVRENPEVDRETVSQVYQKGYRMGDRIIRHAKVIVDKPVQEDGSSEAVEE